MTFILILIIASLVWMWFSTMVTLYIFTAFMIEQHYRFPGQDEMKRLQKFVISNMLNDLSTESRCQADCTILSVLSVIMVVISRK